MTRNDDVSIEPFFLGPKSENEYWVREKIQSVLDHWFQWRKSLFIEDPPAIGQSQLESGDYKSKRDTITQTLSELNELLKAETPKYTPRYIGHMVSEVSLPAILGHFSALLHNPNNTSKEVARVGSLIENQGINLLLNLVGFEEKPGRGHFTSGGTVANFEAIWRARFRMDHWLSLALFLKAERHQDFDLFRSSHMGWDKYHSLVSQHGIDFEKSRKYSLAAGNPWRVSNLISQETSTDFEGPIMLIPGNKHFSWQKGCNLFGFGEEALWSIPLDEQGKLDCAALKTLIEKAHRESRPIIMVVSVAGTTETGEIDPIHKVQDILDNFKKENDWDIWHHVDAAYGGFMCSLCHNPQKTDGVVAKEQLSALKGISRSSSVTLDPHKLGYIPYSCGAFLVPNEQNYAVSKFKAPYLNQEEIDHDKWSCTIEGSRTASGAAATWLTGKTLGFTSEEFAQLILDSFLACRHFKEELEKECPFIYPLHPTETNILCFSMAEEGDTLSTSNKRTSALFERISKGPNFAVSKTVLHKKDYVKMIDSHVTQFSGESDDEYLYLIRCVFMNPFWRNPEIGKKLRSEFIKEVWAHKKEIHIS